MLQILSFMSTILFLSSSEFEVGWLMAPTSLNNILRFNWITELNCKVYKFYLSLFVICMYRTSSGYTIKPTFWNSTHYAASICIDTKVASSWILVNSSCNIKRTIFVLHVSTTLQSEIVTLLIMIIEPSYFKGANPTQWWFRNYKHSPFSKSLSACVKIERYELLAVRMPKW